MQSFTLGTGLNSIALAVLFAGCIATHVSAAPVLPDAATTGGAQPQSLESPGKPLTDFELSIPPRKERPLDLDAGPVFEIDQLHLFQLDPSVHAKYLVEDESVINIINAAKNETESRFTLGRLQQLADQITNYYRSKGLILATAYVPAQEVVDNTIELHLLLGELSNVVVSGDSSYSSEIIERAFADLLGKPLEKASVESALLTVLNYPGLDISGILEPGENVGTTQMQINVNDERRLEGSLFVDNKGSQYSGEERLGINLAANNPFGLADQLELNLVVQNKPSVEGDYPVDNSKFIGATYRFRPIHPDYVISLHAHSSDYEIGRDLAAFAFAGKSEQFSLGIKKQLVRSRTKNSYVEAEIIHDHVENSQASDVSGRDRLTALSARYGFDFSDSIFSGGFTQGNVTYSHGVAGVLGAMENDDPDATRVTSEGGMPAEFDLFEYSLARYQRVSDNYALILSSNGQYSSEPLASVKQMGLGGPNSVRAYPSGEYLADKGLIVSLELVANAPGFSEKEAFNGRSWGEVIQFTVFVDYAKGYKNLPLISEESGVELSGIGVGIQVNPDENISANVTVAKPVSDREASNDKDPQYFAELNYSF